MGQEGNVRPLSLIANTIRRHPLTSSFDLAFLVTGLCALALACLSYDFAEFWSDLTPREREITFGEWCFLLGATFLGSIAFVWRRLLEERQDRARDQELHEQRLLAARDSLTGLANRRAFRAALDHLVHTPNGTITAVYLIDLNGFKCVSDKFGHKAGDAVLRVVGQRLHAAMRNNDILARLGGDEFAVIANNLQSHDDADELSNRFSRALQDVIQVDGHAQIVGAAIGIAFFPEDGETADDILHAADIAMYRAKRFGGTTSKFFREPNRQVH